MKDRDTPRPDAAARMACSRARRAEGLVPVRCSVAIHPFLGALYVSGRLAPGEPVGDVGAHVSAIVEEFCRQHMKGTPYA
jgi:hypothetical protein